MLGLSRLKQCGFRHDASGNSGLRNTGSRATIKFEDTISTELSFAVIHLLLYIDEALDCPGSNRSRVLR